MPAYYKTTNRFVINFVLCFLLPIAIEAQESILGLWMVEKVKVGEEEMTPVAKWFEFKADGSFQAGNGWLQNSAGTYNWNKEERSLAMHDSLAIADPFGAFKVNVDGSSMVWNREEEGMQVKVFAKRSSQLPMAPQDYLVGMWELQSENTDSLQMADHIYFRWDRDLMWWIDEDRSRGLWNFDAHRPILLTILNEERLHWKVEVGSRKLRLTGLSDKNKDKRFDYLRKDQFPN